MKQGGKEFFLGLSGDSTTQTRNGMSDLLYDGIYHLSTGFAAFAGSLLTPYVNAAYGKTGVTAGGSTAGKATGVKPTVTEAAGGTVDDALEQFYDDIFESSYGEQFDPIREQAIAGAGGIEGGSNSANLGNKLDYLFGKVSDSTHNIQRSQSMQAELNRIGIYDNLTGREYITQHMNDVLNNPSNISNVEVRSYIAKELPGQPSVEYTATIRESFLMGPNGGVKLRSVWDGDRLLTVIIEGGEKYGK